MTLDNTARYATCIEDFVSSVVDRLDDNVRAIILQGGLVRDPAPIDGWSDIDLIVVLRKYSDSATRLISEVANDLERLHDVRLDINLLYETDVDSDEARARFYHSELINALSQRRIRLVHGSLGDEARPFVNEAQAVYVYLNTVQNLFRRYYIENVYRSMPNIKSPANLQRIVRWVFSIVRSSLRLRGIYVNPYQESVSELRRLNLVSADDAELLDSLIRIRADLSVFNSMTEEGAAGLFTAIERFVEKYIHDVVHRA